jgi:nucleotide-binding universal stress UspA family protein
MAHGETNHSESRHSGSRHALKRILVATTLEESSDHVVAAGHALARAAGAQLHLLHAYVMPAIYYGSPMGMATVYPYTLEGERERVEHGLAAQLRRAGVAAADVAGQLLEVGTPHRLLAAAARSLSADLILVGASEAGGAFAPLLGSTADRVLRLAHVAVLVVRSGFSLPLARVLAPIDLSELSDESLRHGLDLVGAVSEEPPRLETLFVLSHIERVGSSQFTPEQVERFAHEELERHTRSLAEETGWRAEPTLRTGLPRQEILSELEKAPADLVILGTHGRSGFERLLMGSVAADVVRQASVSVLVVPPAAARETEAGGGAQ